MDQYSHIHSKYRHIMALSDYERIEFINSVHWIGYSEAKRILKNLEDLLQFPKRPRMPNLLIIGDPNNGKTTLINRFYDQYKEPYETEDYDLVMPIVFVQSPHTSDEKKLYMKILEQLQSPYRESAPANVLSVQVLHLMRTYRVKMLIIDEFHCMFNGTARQQRDMMNAIKDLCNELQIPIVGVGTQSAANILFTDKQFASRFKTTELPVWTLSLEYQRMLSSVEQTLPLKQASGLHQPEIAQKIFYKAQGNLGNIINLLAECAVEAIEDGSERIDIDMINRKKGFLSTADGRL